MPKSTLRKNHDKDLIPKSPSNHWEVIFRQLPSTDAKVAPPLDSVLSTAHIKLFSNTGFFSGKCAQR